MNYKILEPRKEFMDKARKVFLFEIQRKFGVKKSFLERLRVWLMFFKFGSRVRQSLDIQ